MQLRLPWTGTSDQYVTQKAWQGASLERCPRHPEGGCGFESKGYYPRKEPPGTLVARYYCPPAHETYSLLPDCLAAKVPGTLAEIEEAVVRVEQSASQEEAVGTLRIDTTLPAVLRWLRRRLPLVRAGLLALAAVVAAPGLHERPPTVTGLREALGTTTALQRVRELGAAHLDALPPPLGFGRRPLRRGKARGTFPHDMGTDPP